MTRRGYTLRVRGKAIARFTIPGQRVRFGFQRSPSGPTVSFGFLIVRWWGFR